MNISRLNEEQEKEISRFSLVVETGDWSDFFEADGRTGGLEIHEYFLRHFDDTLLAVVEDARRDAVQRCHQQIDATLAKAWEQRKAQV